MNPVTPTTTTASASSTPAAFLRGSPRCGTDRPPPTGRKLWRGWSGGGLVEVARHIGAGPGSVAAAVRAHRHRKTFAGFGALRRVAEAGLPRFGAEFASWPELLAQLRPGSGEEREQGLRRLMDAPWLLLDDLGRAKDSAWTEEILYRLVNHRYNVMLPTIITTNVPLKQFTAVFGDAPGGRLIEMTAGGRVAVTGEDRRLVR